MVGSELGSFFAAVKSSVTTREGFSCAMANVRSVAS